jgi:hypothetical protein
MFGCCCNQVRPLSAGVAVTMIVRTGSGGVPFPNMATPDGYYPEGDFFSQRAPVITACISRAVELVNQIQFASSVDSRLPWDVYRMVHPNPVYTAPGLRISAADASLLVATFDYKAAASPGNFPLASWGPPSLVHFIGGSHWNQTSAFTQIVVAAKAKIEFSEITDVCVGTFRHCNLSSPYSTQNSVGLKTHTLPAFGFDVLTERSNSPCGAQLTYWKWSVVKVGSC